MNNIVKKFKNKLAKGNRIVLSGAMGTEISRRGIKTSLPLWSAVALLESPEMIKQIHIDYINAGAEIIVTNTFRTQGRTFKKAGIEERASELTILAVNLAKDARSETGKSNVLIAGSVTTLEDCYSPELVPSETELKKEHLEHAQNLKEGGVDFLLIETINSIKEAVAAIEAAQIVGLPFAISFIGNDKGQLLSRESLADAVGKIEKFKPLYIGLNCMTIDAISKNAEMFTKLTDFPVSFYGQGDGVPDNVDGWKFEGKNPKHQYINQARKWSDLGVQIIGGCCGTDPSYINAISRNL